MLWPGSNQDWRRSGKHSNSQTVESMWDLTDLPNCPQASTRSTECPQLSPPEATTVPPAAPQTSRSRNPCPKSTQATLALGQQPGSPPACCKDKILKDLAQAPAPSARTTPPTSQTIASRWGRARCACGWVLRTAAAQEPLSTRVSRTSRTSWSSKKRIDRKTHSEQSSWSSRLGSCLQFSSAVWQRLVPTSSRTFDSFL